MKKAKIKRLKKKCKDLLKENTKLYGHLREVCNNPNSEKSSIIKMRVRLTEMTEKTLWT